MIAKVSLERAFGRFGEQWSPRVAAAVDDYELKLARVQGEFVWHRHEEADELFLVVRGRLCLRLRDGELWLEQGELAVVPRGVEHCPYAPQEAWIALFERRGTPNTGSAGGERTVEPVPLEPAG